jgi:hypothetical protein
MLMSDVLRVLRRCGVEARHWHVRHLIAAGDLQTPQRDSSGRFQFTDADLEAIRKRLQFKNESLRAERPGQVASQSPRAMQEITTGCIHGAVAEEQM